MKKMNVESFNLDHTKVAAPYVRLAGRKTGAQGDEIYKYDLRFTQPNKEFMKMDALHDRAFNGGKHSKPYGSSS